MGNQAPWAFPPPTDPSAAAAIIKAITAEAKLIGLESPRSESLDQIRFYGLSGITTTFSLLSISTAKIVAWTPDIICDIAVCRLDTQLKGDARLLHYLFSTNGTVLVCEDHDGKDLAKVHEIVDGWTMGIYQSMQMLTRTIQGMARVMHDTLIQAERRNAVLGILCQSQTRKHFGGA